MAVLAICMHGRSAFAAAPSHLDGVFIEAIEAYPTQSRSAFFLGSGVYPFNSYFNSFSFNLAFDYWMSRGFSWEILDFDYFYSVTSGLTEQLADSYGVNPVTIERPNYLLSTQGIFHFAYGKLAFVDQKIRYFKMGMILGGGVLRTSQETIPTVNVGLRFHCHVSETFSWKIEVRDAIAIRSGVSNIVTFSLGGGIGL